MNQRTINESLWSIEGQYLWDLNATLRKEIVVADVRFEWPIVVNNRFPISIRDTTEMDAFIGVYNQNLDENLIFFLSDFFFCLLSYYQIFICSQMKTLICTFNRKQFKATINDKI